MSFAWLRRWLALLPPAAEFAWLAPWVLVLSAAFYPGLGRPVLSWGALAALLGGGYLLNRLALLGPAGRPVIGRGVILALALGLGLWAVWASHYSAHPFFSAAWPGSLLVAAHDALPAIPPPVMGALVAPLLVWRGIVLGGREFSYFTADQAFRRGVAWSALFALLLALYHDTPAFAPARQSAPGFLLGFFFLSLVMLAGSRLIGIWEESRRSEGQAPALGLNRPWLALVVTVAAAIVVAGALLAGLAGGDIWPYVLPILRVLEPLLEVLFLIVFFFASLVARAIWAVLSRLPRRQPVERPSTPGDLGDFLRRLRELEISPDAVSDARWGMVALVILILMAAIVFAVVRSRRGPRRTGDDDERESVWDPRSLGRGLRRLVPRWGLRDSRDAPAGDPAVVAIRLLYRRLLRAAGEIGRERRPDQTAREFEGILRPMVSGADAELALVTRLYEAVRYGDHLPPAQDVEATRERVDRLIAGLAQHDPARGP